MSNVFLNADRESWYSPRNEFSQDYQKDFNRIRRCTSVILGGFASDFERLNKIINREYDYSVDKMETQWEETTDNFSVGAPQGGISSIMCSVLKTTGENPVETIKSFAQFMMASNPELKPAMAERNMDEIELNLTKITNQIDNLINDYDEIDENRSLIGSNGILQELLNSVEQFDAEAERGEMQTLSQHLETVSNCIEDSIERRDEVIKNNPNHFLPKDDEGDVVEFRENAEENALNEPYTNKTEVKQALTETRIKLENLQKDNGSDDVLWDGDELQSDNKKLQKIKQIRDELIEFQQLIMSFKRLLSDFVGGITGLIDPNTSFPELRDFALGLSDQIGAIADSLDNTSENIRRKNNLVDEILTMEEAVDSLDDFEAGLDEFNSKFKQDMSGWENEISNMKSNLQNDMASFLNEELQIKQAQVELSELNFQISSLVYGLNKIIRGEATNIGSVNTKLQGLIEDIGNHASTLNSIIQGASFASDLTSYRNQYGLNEIMSEGKKKDMQAMDRNLLNMIDNNDIDSLGDKYKSGDVSTLISGSEATAGCLSIILQSIKSVATKFAINTLSRMRIMSLLEALEEAYRWIWRSISGFGLPSLGDYCEKAPTLLERMKNARSGIRKQMNSIISVAEIPADALQPGGSGA